MSPTESDLHPSEQRLLDLAERMLNDGAQEQALPDEPGWQKDLAEVVGGLADETPKRVGERVGHYRIADLLGQGGMGAVYRGYDEFLDRPVAIKTLRFREGFLSAEARARLLREARSLAKLDHPGICRVYDFVEEKAEHGDSGAGGATEQFLILELIEGETLRAALTGDSSFSRAEILQILEDIARALHCAHRAGVVHRDLKPDNVMLDHSGSVRVMDFGIARWHQADLEDSAASDSPSDSASDSAENQDAGSESRNAGVRDNAVAAADSEEPGEQGGEHGGEPGGEHGREATTLVSPAALTPDSGSPRFSEETALTRPGSIIGTPSFMSPEQLAGDQVTSASDIYSFGLIACEALSGRRLDEGGESSLLSQIRRGLTPALGSAGREVLPVLKSTLQKDPAARPSALEVAEKLRRVRRRPVRRLRAAMVVSVMMVILASLAFATWTRAVRSAENRAVADLPRPVRLLVLPFTNQTGEEAMDWVTLGLRALVVESLSEAIDVNVVPLDRTLDLVASLDLSELESIDHEELLRESGAQLLLAAVLGRPGRPDDGSQGDVDRYVLGELLAVREQRRSLREVIATDPTVAARNLADRLARRVDPGAVLKETHSGDPFVDRLYAVAVSGILTGDDAVGAQVLLGHALRLEPGFHRARLQRSAALVQSADWEEALLEVSLVRSALGPERDGDLAIMALDQEASVYINQGEFGAARGVLNELTAVLTERGEDGVWQYRVANQLSNIHLQRSEYDEALQLLTRLVKELRGHPEEKIELMFSLFRLGAVLADLKKTDEAHEVLAEALALAREQGMRRSEGSIINTIGSAYERAERFEEALAMYQQAEEISAQVGDLVMLQALITNRAVLLVSQGRFEEGHELALESLRVAEKIGVADDIALVRFNLSFTACNLGRVREAREHWTEAAAFYSPDDWDMLLVLGWIQFLEGDSEAVVTLERSKALADGRWDASQEELLEQARGL